MKHIRFAVPGVAIAIVFLFQLVATPLARAGDFEVRIAFLREEIAKFDALPPEAHEQLKEGLNKYAAARVKLFEALIKTMAETKTDVEAWKKIAEKGKELPKMIFERLDSSIKGGGFKQMDDLNKLIQQEIAFYGALAAGNLSVEHDVIVHNALGLEEMIKNLDKKWGGVLYLDDSVDDQWEDYWEEIIDVFDDFRSEMNSAIDDYISNLKRSPTGLGGALATWLAKLDKKLQVMRTIFYVSKKSLEQTHQKAMRQVAPKEFDMVQVFLNNRKRAKEFVDNHGLHHAEKAFERAEAMADRTCDSLEGEDIEQDCQILYVRALANLNIHYERAETENERFVSENQGRFLGGVDSSTRGALLEESQWSSWGGSVPVSEVINLVKRMENEYFRDPPWKGGGLSQEVRDEIKSYLDDSWLEIAKQDTLFLRTLQENDFKKVIEHRKKLAYKIDSG